MATASLITTIKTTTKTEDMQTIQINLPKEYKQQQEILANYRNENNWLWRTYRGPHIHTHTCTLHLSSAIYWLLVTTLLTLSASYSHADYYNNGGSHWPPPPSPPLQPIPPPAGIIPNVTCIAHDTKFTCDCQYVNQVSKHIHLCIYVCLRIGLTVCYAYSHMCA